MDHTGESVLNDFTARRAALIRALTTEADELYTCCDPDEVNLNLIAYPDETWKVCPPLEEAPPEIPEPVLGINFCRDGMDRKEWLEFIAAASDAWLMCLSFYFGARFGFDKKARKCLFRMVNGLPTILEVLTGTERKEAKAKQEKVKPRRRRKKPDRWTPKPRLRKRKPTTVALPDKDEDSEKKEGEEKEGAVDEYPDALCCYVCGRQDHPQSVNISPFTAARIKLYKCRNCIMAASCGACGNGKGNDEFFILCDGCYRWFHGQCVSISPSTAERIMRYSCPFCCGVKVYCN